MAELDRHKAIPILFGYIDDYESGGKFESEEFINYFENVLAHLKLVRDQNNLDIIKGVDDTLVTQFDRVPFTTPFGGTDIRYFSSHILATFFPVLIPMSAQFQANIRRGKKVTDITQLECPASVRDYAGCDFFRKRHAHRPCLKAFIDFGHAGAVLSRIELTGNNWFSGSHFGTYHLH